MKYARIAELLRHLESTYQAQICIKDFAGFIPINRELEHAIQPFLSHSNPYCMFVKQDKNRYMKCLCSMRPLHDKCSLQNDGFWTLCHAGLREYVVPIRLDDKVLGCIQIGYFSGAEERANKKMEQLFQQCDTSVKEEAAKLLESQRATLQTPIEQLLPILHLLADHLAFTYMEFKPVTTRLQLNSQRKKAEDIIVSTAIKYIKENYTTKIMVKQIAQICHCCESHISHIFCRHTGVSISTYINKVRVEHAKHYLLTSAHRIVEIASMVGFADPNYFTRVFTELMAISPSEFRRRYAA